MALVLLFPTPSIGAPGAGTLPSTVTECANHIAEAARWSGLPEVWIEQVMRAESDGRTYAISKAGAMGCMQLMPTTWRDLTRRHALGSDPFEPRANMLGGAAYLRSMHDRFGWPGALAAYHAGPNRYAEHLAGVSPLPHKTLAYVALVTDRVQDDGAIPMARPAESRAVDWRGSALFAGQIERDQRRSDERDSTQARDYGDVLPTPSVGTDTTAASTITTVSATAQPLFAVRRP